MGRISVAAKYRICQLVTWASVVIGAFCLSRMSSRSSPHHNKVWFGLAIVDVVIGIPFAVGYYYFRAKLKDVDTGLTEVKTLADSADFFDERNNGQHKQP